MKAPSTSLTHDGCTGVSSRPLSTSRHRPFRRKKRNISSSLQVLQGLPNCKCSQTACKGKRRDKSQHSFVLKLSGFRKLGCSRHALGQQQPCPRLSSAMNISEEPPTELLRSCMASSFIFGGTFANFYTTAIHNE